MSERWGVWMGNGTPGTCGGTLIKGLPTGTPLLVNVYPFWSGCTGEQAVGAAPKSGFCRSFAEMRKQINAPTKMTMSGWFGGIFLP